MEDRPPIITVKDSPSPSTGEVTPQLESTKPQMFRFLSNIFEVIVPRDHTGSGFDEWPAFLERADGGLEIGKALRTVVSILQYLREKSPAIIAPATKVLADGSRYGKLAMVVSEVLQEGELLADTRPEPWRLPFGDEKMLDFYLDLLAADEIEHDWTSDALRLIGNTCADLDINRERALAKLKLPALLDRLQEEGKASIAIGVLCNLCLDYELAQVALRANRLFPSLITLLERRCYKQDYLPQIALLLDVAIEDFNPELYSDTQAVTIIHQALTIPGVDIETQVSLANAIVALLKHEQIQKALLEDYKLSIILDLFVFSYTQDAASTNYFSTSESEPPLHHPVQDPEDEAQLTALRSALSAKLWDMTALTEFTIKYLPASKLVQRLISWLSIDEPQMQVCACSILRNVASSDQNATDMVKNFKVHWLLRSLLEDVSNPQVLEESIRLMKNLAVPAANKKELESFESVTLVWSKFESPTLHYAAASLVRQLVRGCFDNVYLFLRPNTSAKDDSYASRLLHLYSNTNDPAIKIEVARTIVEVWRTANSGNSEEVRSRVFRVEKAVRELNLRPDEIVKPVVAMIAESGNQSLVTEGWFGLALMTSSEEWGEAVYNALCGDATKGVFKAAVSCGDAHSKDRDNARILVDRLLKYSVGLLPRHKRSPDDAR
ncbi:hypothetical protein HO133_001855 [Letharia lupina]|uniref:ARM repeat-containing protein n=1 Tax=Letharia lupina TaxID=560253 RepID=A0A8H6FB16_9LECA|nr:uncharacterized protein HO133_001855 [Letharia lupina]KAF6221887.1 hypothetical protein HO133_001855 [Letharia lupina]